MTASTLYKLQQQTYMDRQEIEARMTFNEWCCLMKKKSPAFQFWSKLLNIKRKLLNSRRICQDGF